MCESRSEFDLLRSGVYGYPDVIEFIFKFKGIEMAVDINATDRFNATPFSMACEFKEMKSIRSIGTTSKTKDSKKMFLDTKAVEN